MIITILASLVLASPAALQTVGGDWDSLGQVEGALMATDAIGGTLEVGPDLDGDGIPEFAVGSHGHLNAFGQQVGLLQLYSGKTGTILWEYEPLIPDSYPVTSGSLSFVSDLNGDGVADLLAGNLGFDGVKGKVVVLSGLDGSLIREHFGVVGTVQGAGEGLGAALLGLQDLDGDGFGDYLISSHKSENPAGDRSVGRIDCWSGATGFLLWQSYGRNESDFFGRTLTFGPDTSGIGQRDILTSTRENVNGVLDAGMVYTLSQPSGVILRSYPPATMEPLQGYGDALTTLPDLDGDSIDEIIVGARYFDTPNKQGAGYVTMLSSATGLPLWRTDGTVGHGSFGEDVMAVDDLNQDGYKDLLVYQPTLAQLDEPRVLVLNGRDGSILWEFKGESQYTGFGISMGAFDRTGDGIPELLIGEPLYGFSFPGRVVALTLDPFLRNRGSLSLSASAPSELRFQVDFPVSEAGKSFGILASSTGNSSTPLGGIDVPLTFDPFFQRSLQSPPPNFRGSLNSEGDHQVRVRVPAGQLTNLIGTTLYFAAISYSGTQASLSSVAVPIVVVP
ncbi:MAG: FG-GAP and VCBS repeat-containing protein [Planctomycetota bacterium]